MAGITTTLLVCRFLALIQRNPLTSAGQLGKGAFATVYRIATKMEGKILAAKELEKRRFIKNGQLDKKIDNEMRIMQGLRHPNIVEFVEHHDQGDYLYIIMEYVPHGDLQAHLHQEGPLSEPAARAMAQQILSALGYLHHSRITHRDIKPDNILIAEQNPLKVKLSDFGLSKVVKHDDTFLKTFCGTLLYCAPEVFPDYGTTKGTKRRRGAKQYHSYSSTVDIWSFGGVLWYALCKEPPFKGIADATGEAMYNNIIATPLDPRPLQRAGISDTCIDLLTRMLLVDPALRPTARDCLKHPWLEEGATLPADPNLQSIVEEDESEETEQKLSQLSIGAEKEEEEDEISGSEEEADVLSDEELVGFVDANRQTKRIRADTLHPQNNIRDTGAFSTNASFQSDYGVDEEESFDIKTTPDRGRLFGEIGQSALQSSGILESHIRGAMVEENSQDSSLYGSEHLPMYSHTADRAEREIPFSAPPPYLENPFSSPSLLGAESMVRDLNMVSEQGATTSTDGTYSLDGPTTPRTPEVAQRSSLERSSKFPSLVSEATPKARPSGASRQISLPLTASYYYDPLDPSTHNLEYASRVSGYDFVKAQKTTTVASGYEETVGASEPTNSNSSIDVPSEGGAEPSASAAVPSLPAELDIRPPPRRLGKLVSTNDSFVVGLTINIDQSQTSWGRISNNTVVYENSRDTRIPKTAFVLFWYSSAGESAETVQQMSQEGKDWTSLPELHSGIWACATHGISVNGKHMVQKDDKGRALYGHLHTGDIVQVYGHRRGGECLKFRCEFYLGSGKEARASGNDFSELLGNNVAD
jgi:serine/threonine protein kinase